MHHTSVNDSQGTRYGEDVCSRKNWQRSGVESGGLGKGVASGSVVDVVFVVEVLSFGRWICVGQRSVQAVRLTPCQTVEGQMAKSKPIVRMRQWYLVGCQ